MTQGIDLSKDTPELSESLEASSEKSEISWSRRQDAWFVVLAIVCLLLFMALGSYTPGDDGWSSVGGRSSHNSVGVVGATIADLLFHGLGYLAYAFPTLILAKIALMFRRRSANTASIWFLRVFGFVMTLASLCSLAHVSIWPGEELPVGLMSLTSRAPMKSSDIDALRLSLLPAARKCAAGFLFGLHGS